MGANAAAAQVGGFANPLFQILARHQYIGGCLGEGGDGDQVRVGKPYPGQRRHAQGGEIAVVLDHVLQRQRPATEMAQDQDEAGLAVGADARHQFQRQIRRRVGAGQGHDDAHGFVRRGRVYPREQREEQGKQSPGEQHCYAGLTWHGGLLLVCVWLSAGMR